MLALLGPNGAGKTSTVEALEGYRPIAGGTVRVLGLDPGRDHAALVPRIGVMLQKGGVYPMLGPAQVLHLFAAYYDDPEDPDALLDQVGLADARRTPWRRLSGGEQQRLSLALALVGRPEVLFLDEPTAGVDPEGRIVVRDLIAAQRDKGLCVLLTTHELDEAERVADRVVIIDQGRLLAEGTPAELASGTADGSVRFSTDPGIDTAALAAAIGVGRLRRRGAPRRLPAAPARRHRDPARRRRAGRLAGRAGPRPRRPAHRTVARGGLPGHHRRPGRAPDDGGPTRHRAGRRRSPVEGDGADAAAGRPAPGRGDHDLHQRRDPVPDPRDPGGVPAVLQRRPRAAHRHARTRSTSWCPGILALAVMSTSMTALSIGTGFERGYGVLKRLGSTPLGRPRLLAAKILAVLAVEILQAAVLVGVGVPPGLEPGWTRRGRRPGRRRHWSPWCSAPWPSAGSA